jgi:integrase
MAHDLLTDKEVRAAKPAAKPFKLADGRGMSLIVMPSGAKSFRLKFRMDGVERSFGLGSYPDTSLALARKNRDAARALIAAGVDPVQHKRETRAARTEARRYTFETAAEAYFKANAASWSETHQRDVRRIIDRELVPGVGNKPMSAITLADAQGVIDGIIAREAYTFARDVRMYARAIMKSYNKGRKVQLADPWADVDVAKGPAPVHHAALSRAEVGDFLRRIKNSPATPLVRLGVLLLMHTALRSGELRAATWSEINVSERLWTIAGSRMKNKLDHLVPLSTQSLELIEQLRIVGAQLRGVHPNDLQPDDLLFPHAFDLSRCISENTLIHATWRAGFKGRMTPHGCRSVFSGWANEVGKFNPDAVEAAIAHVTMGAVRKAYNRSAYIEERTRMMAEWSAWLEAQERTATVIPFPAAVAG